MNIENFEKRAQAEFEHYRPETDHDQIWDNIEPHLKKKKRRPLMLFFWGTGLASMLLLLLWVSGIMQKPNPEQLAGSGQISGGSFLQRSQAEQLQAIGQGDALAIDPVRLNQDAPPQDLLPLSAGQQPDILLPNIVKDAQTAAPALPNKQIEADDQFAPFQNEVFTSSFVPIQEVGPADDHESSSQVDTTATGNANKKPDQVAGDKPPAKAKNLARIKPHKRKKNNQTLSLHTGLVMPFRVLQPNDLVEANAELLANRKSTEKALEGFSAGIQYSYATKKGWLFRAGLAYQRLNEKFKVSYEEKETKIVTGVLTQTLNALGQVIDQTTGPKAVTTSRIYSNIAYNHYQFLNLPFGMGYQRLNKKSQWEIAGGLDLNLWFHFDGTIYYPFGTPLPLTKTWYPGVYKRNAGLGMWASYGYSRNLSQNIRWQLLAKTNLPFHPITSEKYPLVQKYFTLGLQGGLVFNLTKAPKNKHKKRK